MSKTDTARLRRAIPAVEKVLQSLGDVDLPRSAVVALVRRELAQLRTAATVPSLDDILQAIRDRIAGIQLTRLQPVINGTGILVHTNLGRSPLAPQAVEALSTVAANYNNLEYDLASGERGVRAEYLEASLALVSEAEAATVVNNCAAALVLILRHFTTGERKEVILSRGELVQIGGGFRIPEILEASGARLREVGTTNKTSLKDYDQAIGPHTALILKVHRSNFFMDGFVDSPAAPQLAALARAHQIPFVEDLGSGATVQTETTSGVEHEPTPREVLSQGVDLVCFSGDKLFGGPQAGIIAGQATLVKALKKEPFFRALRCDKLIFAALQATVDLYLRSHEESIPVLQMMRLPNETLQRRAEAIIQALGDLPVKLSVGEGRAQIGGGTLPRSEIASVTLDIHADRGGASLDELAAKLRRGAPPIIGYVSSGKFKIDLRTVFPRQDRELTSALRQALALAPPKPR